MDENLTKRHAHSVDRMFEVAQGRAQERRNSLTEKGHVSQAMLDALDVFLGIALSRDGDPDIQNRLHQASRDTLESDIGSFAVRQRAVRIGGRIAIASLRRGRLITLKEDAPVHPDDSE